MEEGRGGVVSFHSWILVTPHMPSRAEKGVKVQ